MRARFCVLCLMLNLTGQLFLTSISHCDEANMTAAREFIEDYKKNIRPLEIASGKAWWNANTTGKDEDFAEKEAIENRLNELLSSAEKYEEIKRIHDSEIEESQLARQVELLYLTYLSKQLDLKLLNRISAKETEIEKTFNVFRATVGEESFSDSQVRDVLQKSKDSNERKQVWEASKLVGEKVATDLRELVLLRNQAAKQLGFDDYHAMQLELNEQSQEQVLQLFNELDQLTRKPFANAKSEIDALLAQDYGLSVEELRPWHYHDPFFQESPAVYEVDLNGPYAKADILQICKDFYEGIDLPIEDVIKRSDLYEKPKKSPHAFCIDIDREGDVRVLANITPTEYWMSTMLHELGHAVYSSKFIPKEVPYLLRTNSHILTTEGVAMMFERFSSDANWLAKFGVEVDNADSYTATGRRMRRDQLLIFSRWCQVMLRFEIELYKNPDQDLNKLWWDLIEKYQLIKRPKDRDAPDYASKIHVVTAPAYYHNYMMGELFACQLHAALVRELGLASDPTTAIYARNPKVGAFMKQKVFAPGLSLSWNELTKFATGETLNAKAFAEEFKE